MDEELRTRQRLGTVTLMIGVLLVAGGCSDDPSRASAEGAPGASASTSAGGVPDTADSDHPDVLAAEISRDDDGTWTVSVTISSEYDSADRYADGWRVLGPGGELLGTHELSRATARC